MTTAALIIILSSRRIRHCTRHTHIDDAIRSLSAALCAPSLSVCTQNIMLCTMSVSCTVFAHYNISVDNIQQIRVSDTDDGTQCGSNAFMF